MAEVTGTVTRQFAAPRFHCPLSPECGWIDPIEEEWFQHFVIHHSGNAVPTQMPHIEIDGDDRCTEREAFKCRIPGCTAYFPTRVLLGGHLVAHHGC